MKIYNAIMMAADHIERNPREFDYYCTGVPDAPCGSPGCAIGWVNFFTSTCGPGERLLNERWLYISPNSAGRRPISCKAALGVDDGKFYARMDELSGGWRAHALECARALRRYAERHHGHEKPKPVVPDWNVIASSPLIPEHVKSEELMS